MSTQNSAIYDFENRASRYESDSMWITSETINRIPLSFFSSLEYYGNLIDVGGGTGFLSFYLHNSYHFRSTTILDASPAMLAYAKDRMPDARIVCDTIEHFAANNNKTYDVVLARQILHYVDDVKEVVCILRGLLKSDGLLYIGQFVVPSVISDHWHESLIKQISPNRKRSFTQDRLLRLFLDEGFKMLRTEYTIYEENIKDFYKRKTNQSLDYPSLYRFAVSTLNKDVQRDLCIEVTDDNLFFNVQFCHILLSV